MLSPPTLPASPPAPLELPTLTPLHPDTSELMLPAQLTCLPCPPRPWPRRSSSPSNRNGGTPWLTGDPLLPASLVGPDEGELTDETDDSLEVDGCLRGRPIGEERWNTQG